MRDKKLTDDISRCPSCFNDMTAISEEFVCGIQTKCILRCCVCGFTLKERTTKKAIKKWNKGDANG